MTLTKTPICDFGKKAENFELNDLKNVDTTTVTPSDGDTIVFDSTTNKFEAAAGIDGGFYGS